MFSCGCRGGGIIGLVFFKYVISRYIDGSFCTCLQLLSFMIWCILLQGLVSIRTIVFTLSATFAWTTSAQFSSRWLIPSSISDIMSSIGMILSVIAKLKPLLKIKFCHLRCCFVCALGPWVLLLISSCISFPAVFLLQIPESRKG